VIVTVNGQDWNVSTFTGSYYDYSPFFIPYGDAVGVMPWWSNPTLAMAFATAVGEGLGVFPETVVEENVGPEIAVVSFCGGPLFAFSFSGSADGSGVTFVVLSTSPSGETGFPEKSLLSIGEAAVTDCCVWAQAIPAGTIDPYQPPV
jgi:hypothetical protein